MSIATEAARVVPPRPNALLSAPIVPTLLRLTLPNLLGMLATALVAIAETTYVGQLGTSSLAGLALVFPIVMLQQMMSSGAMGGGVSSAIARALGAGHDERAASLAVHAMIIGLIGGLAFSAIMLVGGNRIFALLGGRGPALEAALTYANVVFFGSVGVWLTNTLASICRGTGNMKVPSGTLLATAGLQVLLGGALGFGFGPLPRLG
ncbi:MAG: MATE family efflux transporter, partial [Hyphomicrobiaceae bacterium]